MNGLFQPAAAIHFEDGTTEVMRGHPSLSFTGESLAELAKVLVKSPVPFTVEVVEIPVPENLAPITGVQGQ